MEQQILNNKIGIQIITIIVGTIILLNGLLLSIFSYIGYINNYYSFTLLGCTMIFIGIATIVSGTLKIVNYSRIKKSLTNIDTNTKPMTAHPITVINDFDQIKNKIASLQQMKNDGLISESEYEELRSSVIKNARGVL